jgi:hypothetical protein
MLTGDDPAGVVGVDEIVPSLHWWVLMQTVRYEMHRGLMTRQLIKLKWMMIL